MENKRPLVRGRGAGVDPPNRFESAHFEWDLEQVEGDDEYLTGLEKRATEYIPDQSRSIVSENDSPDVGFRYSVNPYRGCAHGCSYCYARPTHEYLGYSAGIDFESKIFYKPEAARLFREFLNRRGWRPEHIALSGVTDPYQPCERKFRLSRACLEVAVEFRQPLVIITKNALIQRDLDLLANLASESLVHANLSITTLDAPLARSMEPRTSPPERRLGAVRALAEAGIPVRVMIAPVIPGLNDHEIPAILREARKAGALSATYVLLRLPLAVADVFVEWLERAEPLRASKVLARVRETRGGKLNCSTFGTRMRGEGSVAERIRERFHLFAAREGLDRALPAFDLTRFRRPDPDPEQLKLF